MDENATWRVIDDERNRLADLLDDLSEPEWNTRSLCEEWTVREVAAHLTLAHTGPVSATIALLRAGGGFNRMIRDTAIRQARGPVGEHSRRLRSVVGSRRTAPFLTAREPLIDILCHAQDIARPIGRVHPTPVEAAREAAGHIWVRSFPFRAQRRLRGFELSATDIRWRVGEGDRVEGPMAALLLLVSGRPTALSELSGPGTQRLVETLTPGRGMTAEDRS